MAVRIFTIIVLAICWPCALYKLRDLARNPRARPLRALCLALIMVTLGLTFQPLAPNIDQLFGRLDTGRALSNSTILLAAAAAQLYLLYMGPENRITKRVVRAIVGGCAVSVAAIVVMFLVAKPGYPVSDPYVTSMDYYHDPAQLTPPWVYVYVAYLGVSMLAIVRLAWRFAKMSHLLLRVGMHMIAVGAVFGLIYCVMKLGLASRDAFGVPWPGSVSTATPVYLVSILLILNGSILPSWGGRMGLNSFCEWCILAKSYWKLRPLHHAVARAVPEVVLFPPAAGVTGGFRFLRTLRARRAHALVEFHDSRTALASYMPLHVSRTARAVTDTAGLVGLHAEAVIEAIRFAAAIRLAAAVKTAADNANPDNVDRVIAMVRREAGLEDLDTDAAYVPEEGGEYKWWELVSGTYNRSPLVTMALREAGTPALTTPVR